MMTPQNEIKHLTELARIIRETAQDLCAGGNRDEAMDAVNYAEGIERALLEIAALNDVGADEVDELRSFDASERRSRFALAPNAQPLSDQHPAPVAASRPCLQSPNRRCRPRREAVRRREAVMSEFIP